MTALIRLQTSTHSPTRTVEKMCNACQRRWTGDASTRARRSWTDPLVVTSLPLVAPGLIALSKGNHIIGLMYAALAVSSTVYHRDGECQNTWSLHMDSTLVKCICAIQLLRLWRGSRNGALAKTTPFTLGALVVSLLTYAAASEKFDNNRLYVPLHTLWHIFGVCGATYGESIAPVVDAAAKYEMYTM